MATRYIIIREGERIPLIMPQDLRTNCYCNDHSGHNADLKTCGREINELKTEINNRIKTTVFWTVIILMIGAMGAMFTKQDRVLEQVSDIKVSVQVMQKDIEMLRERINK